MRAVVIVGFQGRIWKSRFTEGVGVILFDNEEIRIVNIDGVFMETVERSFEILNYN